MKKNVLLILMLLSTLYAFSQQSYYYGFAGELIEGAQKNGIFVREVFDFSPAHHAGLQLSDLITAIDGTPAEESFWETLAEKPHVVLTVKRVGNQNFDVPLTGIPVLSDYCIPEQGYAKYDVAGETTVYVTVRTLDFEPIEIVSDPDVDLYAYATFDFEFTGEQTLQQKEIALVLEKILVKKGLKRDRENPDMLIFLEYYSDRRDQYVPPTQEFNTRYETNYNFLTKKWEVQKHLESSESGNYTKTDYFSKLVISMEDAQKMREGGEGSFSIWRANYEVFYSEKANLKEFAENIGGAMLAGFPVKEIECVRYYPHLFTGILYDGSAPGRVCGVIPGSPADKAGIKAGDIIKKCTWKKNGHYTNRTIFRKSYDKLVKKERGIEKYHRNYEKFALTRTSNSYRDQTSSPFDDIYMSLFKFPIVILRSSTPVPTGYDKQPLVFTVERSDRKKQKITVHPEKSEFVRYE
jgi:hypothetical protein